MAEGGDRKRRRRFRRKRSEDIEEQCASDDDFSLSYLNEGDDEEEKVEQNLESILKDVIENNSQRIRGCRADTAIEAICYSNENFKRKTKSENDKKSKSQKDEDAQKSKSQKDEDDKKPKCQKGEDEKLPEKQKDAKNMLTDPKDDEMGQMNIGAKQKMGQKHKIWKRVKDDEERLGDEEKLPQEEGLTGTTKRKTTSGGRTKTHSRKSFAEADQRTQYETISEGSSIMGPPSQVDKLLIYIYVSAVVIFILVVVTLSIYAVIEDLYMYEESSEDQFENFFNVGEATPAQEP